MSQHSSTEPGLYLLVKNIIVNHTSSNGWLLTVNTVRISNRRGAFVKVNVGHAYSIGGIVWNYMGLGLRGYVWHGRPMATAVEF